MKKPEILAPAGSVLSLHAAVNAGADAVYLGGSRFGARAFAGNFEENELLEGLKFAHLHGVKVYLTVNTLFRNEEIKDLYDYILPYYIAGIDAVIVQDVGVLEYIHTYFPDLNIHASTQMTITTPYAFELLKNYGVTRIVPARELSVEELRALKYDIAGNSISDSLELEVFVQGALCVCYSGQCLMSSFIGGRSGNRGRCAQSCRLPYSVCDEEGMPVDIDGDYPLSPKDMCGIDVISELIDAGVDSFKIEGRMKKPEYVAACVRSYRRCVDELIAKGGYSDKAYTCKDEMSEVFNRGGFTKGYFHKKNGKDMMSFSEPGHMGVHIGDIVSVKNNTVRLSLIKDIHKGDILIINVGGEEITLTSNIDERNGNAAVLNVPKSRLLRNGMHVYRKFNAVLENELKQCYEEDHKITISGSVTLKKGENALLKLYAVSDGRDYNIEYTGSVVEGAKSRPITEDVVRDKLGQTGNELFEFSELEVVMDEDVFVPVKALKELRRNGFDMLEEKICSSYERKNPTYDSNDESNEEYQKKESKNEILQNEICSLTGSCEMINESAADDHNIDELVSKQDRFQKEKTVHIIRALVSSREQLEAVIRYGKNIEIVVDLQYFSKSDIIAFMNEERVYGYALPAILRRAALTELSELPLMDCRCLVIRNIDELAYIKNIGFSGEIVIDYSMYCMNAKAVHFIREHFPNAVITYPVELNRKQINSLSNTINNGKQNGILLCDEHYGKQNKILSCNDQYRKQDNDLLYNDTEMIVYGYQQLMVTAQCFMENTAGCRKGSNAAFLLKDRKNRFFFTKAVCKYCYNLIYNNVPTVLFDKDEIWDNVASIRFHFVRENETQVREILDMYFEKAEYKKEFTRGHYNRGVD